MAPQQDPETRTPPADREVAAGQPEAADAAAAAAVAELEDRWRRALADLDNLRKRYARELAREQAAERARVAAAWLPVVDGLDRALAHATGDPDPVVEGVRAVREQALATLAGLGYPRHEETGVPFDPARHEAVKVVDDDGAAPGTVVEVLRPGYGQGEQWLRPASVAVAAPRSGRG
ncbi:MAG TPA: nucleotide exchange factor GrpE [Actinomycetota bacterium]